MKFKYVSKAQDRVATMLLYDEIGGWGINGAMFASELTWLANSGEYDSINVRINSVGGSVFDGMSIFSAMVNSRIPVNVFIDYLAASMGGVIAMAGKRIYMAKNGLIMIHPPYNPGGAETDKEQEILSKIKDSLVSVFESKTGKSGEFITGLMDKETWLTASEAMAYNMVDEIFDPLVSTKNNSRELEFISKISAQLKTKMDTPIELEALKGELDKLKAIVNQHNEEVEALKAENEKLKTELEQRKNELSALREKEATEYVDSLERGGKIKKEAREGVLNAAKKDLDLVKSVYDAIPASTANRFVNAISTQKDPSGRESWTHRDYEEKDPKALAEIYKNDPERAKRMRDEYYKK